MRCIISGIKKKFTIFVVLLFTGYLFIFFTYFDMWVTRHGSPTLSSVILPYVIVHIDLKGGPPKLKYLESLLPLLKDHGVNGLLMEYEDMFPYEGRLNNLSARNHYNKIELKNFLIKARNLDFEIIPLIQTFGHMEHALKLKEFKMLREHPVYPDSICPSQEQSRILIKEMLEQVVKFHNSVSPLKHVHVGCDEVYQINSCRQCVARKISKRHIFMDHVTNIVQDIKDISSNITVLIWDDMLRSIKPNEWTDIDNIPNVEPVVWSYTKALSLPHISLFQYHKKFSKTWAATAFKGADGSSETFPNLRKRALNHFAWMNHLLDYKYPGENMVSSFEGIVLTGWSRYNHMEPSCELLPVSIPSLVLNLLIVKRFKEGVVRDDRHKHDGFSEFIFHIRDNIERSLNCSANIHIDSIDLPCSFEGSKLYNILKQLMRLVYEVTSNLSSTTLDVYALEYYFKLKYKNIKTVNKNLVWCNNKLVKLTELENKLIIVMKRYYDDSFIYEYVTDKTYNVKKHLEVVIKTLNKFKLIQEWDRGPRLVNFTKY